MKVAFFSYVLSLLWHVIFFLFIPSAFYQTPNFNPRPEVKFLGQIVESIRTSFSHLKEKDEFLFENLVFRPEREYLKFSVGNLIEQEPIKEYHLKPDLKKVDFDKLEAKEYIILSDKIPLGSGFNIEIDGVINSKLVEQNSITADLRQDFKNWYRAKSLQFYSPFKVKITLGKGR